jgi:hypothetical protein
MVATTEIYGIRNWWLAFLDSDSPVALDNSDEDELEEEVRSIGRRIASVSKDEREDTAADVLQDLLHAVLSVRARDELLVLG